MFEAFVLVCLMGTTNICHTLEDLEEWHTKQRKNVQLERTR